MPPVERPPEGDHLDADRILDLLLDLLPEAEREEAGRHLAICTRCEEMVIRGGAALERRRATASMPATIPATIPATGAATGPAAAEPPATVGMPVPAEAALRPLSRPLLPRLFGSRRILRVGFAVAAGVVVVALLQFLHRPGGPKIPETAEWLPSASETLNLRAGDGGEPLPELAAGLRAYDRRDLQEALRALALAGTSGRAEIVRRVFLGSACAQARQYRRATELLRRCPLEQLPQPWSDESRWTLMVALHGAGDERSADSLLVELAEHPGAVGQRARRLLGRPGP